MVNQLNVDVRTRYEQQALPYLLGTCHGGGRANVRGEYINKNGGVLESHTITTPATPDNSTEYSFTLTQGTLSTTVRFTTDASATQGELQNGLIAAYRSNSIAGKIGVVSATGNNVLITGKAFNLPFNVIAGTGPTAAITAAQTTAAALPALILPGYFVGNPAAATSPLHVIDPTAATDRIVGVALQATGEERDRTGESAVGGFEDSVAVLEDIGSMDMVIVACNVATLAFDDSLYVIYDAVGRGRLTNVATNAIDVSSRVKLVRPVRTTDQAGVYAAPVAITR